MLITALWSETCSELELMEAEKCYISSMLCLFNLMGDPRGRGNNGQPLMMFIAWKL